MGGDVIQYEGQDNTQSPYSTTESDPGKSASPFSCNVCGRSYSRVDHLARHYRSRTLQAALESLEKIPNLTYHQAKLYHRHAGEAICLYYMQQGLCKSVSSHPDPQSSNTHTNKETSSSVTL